MEWAVNLQSVEATDREWLWPNRIPSGEITVIAGVQGIGKSILTIDLLSRVTTGRTWPDGEKCPEGTVVLLAAEDSLSSTIRPRFDAAGADVSKVILVRGAPSKKKGKLLAFDLGRDLPALVNLAETVKDIRAVVIDPLGSYMGGIDTYRENSVRNVMFALRADLAEKYNIAVIEIVHLNKGGDDQPVLARILGSVAFTGFARTVWGVAQDKDDPDRKLFVPIKYNLMGNTVGGMEYYVVSGKNKEGVAKWGKSIDDIAEDVMVDRGQRPRQQRSKAKRMMVELLADGARPSGEVVEAIKDADVSLRTIKSAKKELKIKSVKEPGKGGRWMWKLP